MPTLFYLYQKFPWWANKLNECFYISCYILYRGWICPLTMSGGNCHVAAKQVAPAHRYKISLAIGHGISIMN